MAFDTENELIVRKALADMVESVPETGYVIPAARYCSDFNDFWNQAEDGNDFENQKDIETNLIAATWIYPVNFTDDFESGGADSPLMKFDYELYMFRQYGQLREDEDDAADIFSRKVLVQHNLFIAGWLGLKELFQRQANIAGLDVDVFAMARTNPLVQIEAIANRTQCEFIPGVVGFAVRLQETIWIKKVAC